MPNGNGSVPLSGSIGMGRDLVASFTHGSNTTGQNNLNNDYFRNVSNGYQRSGFSRIDTIPYASGAQRSLGMYRGTVGTYPWVNTGQATAWQNNQGYGTVGTGGVGGSASGGFNTTDGNFGSSVVFGYASGSTTLGNKAVNVVHYVGYCEPGTYESLAVAGKFNDGQVYYIIRGYAQPDMQGASTDYVYSSASTQGGAWTTTTMGRTSFTVNATYPYLILDFEVHNANQYFARGILPRKSTTSTPSGSVSSTYWANPYIKRIS